MRNYRYLTRWKVVANRGESFVHKTGGGGVNASCVLVKLGLWCTNLSPGSRETYSLVPSVAVLHLRFEF